MNRTTIMLTICLLLTTPYILGGEDADYNGNEAQLPSLVVPKTNGRNWYTVSDSEKKAKAVESAAQQAYLQSPEGKAELAELRKTISLRKQRLLLKGDVDLMMQARIQNGTFHSGLPLSVNAHQGPRSLLANFVRKVFVASGLSKTQAKKIVKTMFPTTGMVKREAERRDISMTQVRNEYAMRQMTLHAHLHSVTSSMELRAQVDEKLRYHMEQAEQSQQKLDDLGGYISIADATKKYHQDVNDLKKERKLHFQAMLDKITESESKVEAWIKKPGLVNATTWQELGIDISSGKNKKLLLYQGKAKKILYEEIIKPNITDSTSKLEKLIDSVNITSRLETEHPKLWLQLQEREAEFAELKEQHSKLPATVTYKRLNRHLGLKDHFGQVSESWKHWDASNIGATQAWTDPTTSENFVKGWFIQKKLGTSESDSLPLLHHPDMIWPQALSPESLATSFGTSMSGDLDFISISRQKHKTAFKKKDSWGDIGINNIRELSKAFGLPTHLKSIVENRPLTAKELHKQWKASTLTLSLPTGVLADLGREFNSFFNEAEDYQERYGADQYDWKVLRVDQAEEARIDAELDDFMSSFTF